MNDLKKESIHLDLPDGIHTLHLVKIYRDPSGVPMVLVPGSMENSRIFYSRSFKGFAPYMASHGYVTYSVDLRGKGDSRPRISREVDFTQKEVIEDLKHVFDFVSREHPHVKQIWGSHSWGGVLINCFLLRHPRVISHVDKIIQFGVKRSIGVLNLQKIYGIDFGFRFLMGIQRKLEGHVSPRFFGFESESAGYHKDVVKWIKPGPFVEPADGFDYSEQVSNHRLPETLYLVGASDKFLGHIKDVRRFMDECGQSDHELWFLSRNDGYRHDYGHSDMVTHRDAPEDYFHKIVEWLRR